jgi:tetratricopeptide (TPR) repeat protein
LDYWDDALQWDEDALAMLTRLHGPFDARTVEQEAQVVERLYLLGEEEDKADDDASSASDKGAKQARAAKMRESIVANLPRVTGRLPVILSRIGEVVEHFRASGDHENALKVALWCLDLAKAKVGVDDPLTATQYDAVGAMHWNMYKHAQALLYYQQSLRLFIDLGDLAQAVPVAHGIADCHTMIGDREAEVQYRLHALQLAVEAAGQKTAGAAYQHAYLAAMYAAHTQFVPALKHALQSLRVRQLLELGVAGALYAANVIYRKMRNAVAPAQLTAVLQEGIDAAVQDSSKWDVDAAGTAHVNAGLLALNGSATVAEVRGIEQPLLDSAVKLLTEHKQALSPVHGLTAELANRCSDHTEADGKQSATGRAGGGGSKRSQHGPTTTGPRALLARTVRRSDAAVRTIVDASTRQVWRHCWRDGASLLVVAMVSPPRDDALRRESFGPVLSARFPRSQHHRGAEPSHGYLCDGHPRRRC